MFKAGFVNIIGKPNAGKSTLMNLLVGEQLSVITPKAQTTRKRITGIVNGKDYQVVFTDNPGIVDQPEYRLHEWMNAQVRSAISDADVIIYLITPDELPPEENEEETDKRTGILEILKKTGTPVILLLNKCDLVKPEEIKIISAKWKEYMQKEILPVSALKKTNTDKLVPAIVALLPENPAYFPDEDLTDRDERFFVSEIIRGKILQNYRQEIPYAVEVVIESFREKPEINVIRAVIFVTRDSQKNIIIGNKGEAIKKIGIEARKDIEEFTGKKAFLELFVKIRDNWKNEERSLREFGYN